MLLAGDYCTNAMKNRILLCFSKLLHLVAGLELPLGYSNFVFCFEKTKRLTSLICVLGFNRFIDRVASQNWCFAFGLKKWPKSFSYVESTLSDRALIRGVKGNGKDDCLSF